MTLATATPTEVVPELTAEPPAAAAQPPTPGADPSAPSTAGAAPSTPSAPGAAASPLSIPGAAPSTLSTPGAVPSAPSLTARPPSDQASTPGTDPGARPTADAYPNARVGTVLKGRWRLDALLGVGGMGAVYAATHRNGHRVAIKVLHDRYSSDESLGRRLEQEACAANSIGHPGAVRILDDGRAEDGAIFLVMELLEGEGLHTRLARNAGQIFPSDAMSITYGILDVLAAAHAKGILHGDIKPENVFITRHGEVKVLDFGIAGITAASPQARASHEGITAASPQPRASHEGITAASPQARASNESISAAAHQARPSNEGISGASSGARPSNEGDLFGTPGYMAPEQALGRGDEVGPRTDLWAVAATLHRMLTGRLVHESPSLIEQLVDAGTRAAPPFATVMPQADPAIAALMDRGLAFAAADRFADARKMQEAVRLCSPSSHWGAALSASALSLEPTPPSTAPSTTAPSTVFSIAASTPKTGPHPKAPATQPIVLLKRPTRSSRRSFLVLAGGTAMAAASLIRFRKPAPDQTANPASPALQDTVPLDTKQFLPPTTESPAALGPAAAEANTEAHPPLAADPVQPSPRAGDQPKRIRRRRPPSRLTADNDIWSRRH